MMSEKLINDAIASGRVPSYLTADFLKESRDTPAIVGIVIVTIITLFAVVSRLLCRVLILQRLGLDDGLAVFSLMSWSLTSRGSYRGLAYLRRRFTISFPNVGLQLTFVTFVGLCIELIDLGSGRHFAYIEYVLDVDTVQRTQVLDFAAHIIYTTALLLCRVSGLAFYYRVCGMHKGFKTGVKVVFGILIAGYIPQVLLIVFHCQPVTGLWPYGWEPGTEGYVCLQWGVVYVTNSVISLLCDILLFGVPIAMLRILEMPRRRKIQLGCILLPGVAVVAISITRLVLVVIGQWELDMSWSYNPLLAVEVSEIGATLISLSVPGIKPLVDRYVLQKDGTSQFGGSKYNKNADSQGSKATALSTLKLRSEYSMLGNESAGRYGTRATGGSCGDNLGREGIHVTVDFHINEEQEKSSEVRQAA